MIACSEDPSSGQRFGGDANRFALDSGLEDLGLGMDAAPDLGSENADQGAADLGVGDIGAADLGEIDLGTIDLGAVDLGAIDMGFDLGPDLGPPSICGNGQLEPGESCDDGQITTDCDRLVDGGDGCVEPGTCSPGYIFSNGACVPQMTDMHVHIEVDNFCNMTVTPQQVTVPTGGSISIDWHNHSVDYPVDVWMSYGGGYTDLAQGDTWDEPIDHCTIQSAHTEYADISTACSSFRFLINCL